MVFSVNKSERCLAILEILQKQHKVTVDELSEKFGISKMTVRRDLNFLSNQYNIDRTHGGAELGNQPVVRMISFDDLMHKCKLRLLLKGQAKRILCQRRNRRYSYILKEMKEENISIKRSWMLNERHYGALQGLNKDETRKKYGNEQVMLWRRSVDVRPPALEITDKRYPGNDPKYSMIEKDELPKTENLQDTIKRVVKYFESDIKPEIKNGKRVIIVAHGNSLRALIKYLDNLSDEEVVKL